MVLTIMTAGLAIFLAQSRPTGSATGVSPADRERAGKIATLGWQHFQKQDYFAAEIEFEKAVEIDPKSADVWNGLGWARFNGGDTIGGKKAFEKAVALTPDHPAAQNGLGYIDFAARKYKEAEQHWTVAIKHPAATAPYYGLTKLYLLTGRYDKAEEFAGKALKNAPADPLLEQMQAAAKTKAISPELRKEIEPPVWGKQSPESAKGWRLVAQGQNDEAIEAFRQAIARNPNEMPAHNGLGFALLNGGKIPEARKQFEIVLEADPKAAGALNGLARCQKEAGDLDEAIATWEKLAKMTPGQVNAATFGLAGAYLEKGEHAKSVKLWEQLVKSEPSNPEYKEGLERARNAASKAASK